MPLFDYGKKTAAFGAVGPSCTPAQVEFRPLTRDEWYGIGMGGVNDFIGRGETVFLLRDANSTLSGAGGVLCVYCHLEAGSFGC
jgi:hypothetical protein